MLSPRALCRCIIINKNYTRFNGHLRLSTQVLSDHKIQVKPKPTQEEPLKPETVGLTQFLFAPQITGIIREQSIDFQVHEIDEKGNIIYLTDLGPPQDDKLTKNSSYYTNCTVHVDGVTTPLEILVSKLNIPKSSIKWTGIKAKGKIQTTQRISVKNVPAHHLIESTKDVKSLKLGDYSYCLEPISFDDFKGNHFKILIKNIQPLNPSSCDSLQISMSTTIEKAIQNFREIGFINYFGLQYFGPYSYHTVGQAILQQKWEEVFDGILQPKLFDKGPMSHAKAMWFRDRDPIQIIEKNPSLLQKTTTEAMLLVSLSRFYAGGQGNLLQAFLSIPQPIRQLLTNSFQFFLWNHMASFRLQKFGLQVIPGDLVQINGGSDTDMNINGGLMTSKNLKVLTENDVQNGQYSISDVLLPVPGQLVSHYDNPVMQDYFEQFLMDHQLDIKNLAEVTDSRIGVPYGFYRHLVVKPENMTHKIISYNSTAALNVNRLMPSDLDRIKLGQYCTNDLKQPSGNIFGTILEFSLKSSSDIIVALREVIKL